MAQEGRKTAYVTGSNGFVGLNLCEELLARGWRVVALHRHSSDLTCLGRLPVERVSGDILDPASLARTMPGRADAVFHVAGNINMWSKRNAGQTAVNVEGTRNIVKTALEKNARRLVFTSSLSAYGHQAETVTEQTPSSAPRSWINYERNKWQAEEIVREAADGGLHSCIMNPAAIMGPKDRSSWATMIYLIRDGKLKGIPPGAVPVSHVKEVARAHIAAAERGGNGENYILGGEEISFEELFTLMAKAIGVTLNARVAPVPMLKGIARLQTGLARFTGRPPDLTPEMVALLCSRIRCSDEKAVRELGFKKVPVQTCIDDCVNWLREENLL